MGAEALREAQKSRSSAAWRARVNQHLISGDTKLVDERDGRWQVGAASNSRHLKATPWWLQSADFCKTETDSGTILYRWETLPSSVVRANQNEDKLKKCSVLLKL